MPYVLRAQLFIRPVPYVEFFLRPVPYIQFFIRLVPYVQFFLRPVPYIQFFYQASALHSIFYQASALRSIPFEASALQIQSFIGPVPFFKFTWPMTFIDDRRYFSRTLCKCHSQRYYFSVHGIDLSLISNLYSHVCVNAFSAVGYFIVNYVMR